MRVGLITTVKHNPGDDWVRWGCQSIIEQALGGREWIRWQMLNKHAPIAAVRGLGWLNSRAVCCLPERAKLALYRLVQCADGLLPLWADRLRGVDLACVCGMPAAWSWGGVRCSENEWWGPLVRRRLAGVPLLYLGGGSCQPASDWNGAMIREDSGSMSWLGEVQVRSALCTGRDLAMPDTWAILPCPSVFAPAWVGLGRNRAGEGGYSVVNYMLDAGHYAYGAELRRGAWEASMRGIVFWMRQRYGDPVWAVCHSRRELGLAVRLGADRVVQPGSALELLRVYAGARRGVVNRVHAAMVLGVMGVPVVCVGNDTRLRMLEELPKAAPVAWLRVGDGECVQTAKDALLDAENRVGWNSREWVAEVMKHYVELVCGAFGVGRPKPENPTALIEIRVGGRKGKGGSP